MKVQMHMLITCEEQMIRDDFEPVLDAMMDHLIDNAEDPEISFDGVKNLIEVEFVCEGADDIDGYVNGMNTFRAAAHAANLATPDFEIDLSRGVRAMLEPVKADDGDLAPA